MVAEHLARNFFADPPEKQQSQQNAQSGEAAPIPPLGALSFCLQLRVPEKISTVLQ
jgi:hypothetical protein